MKARVALVACSDYESENVRAAVRRALELLGGLSAVLPRGESALLKPNLLSARNPDRAVTTHPAVLEPLIEASRAAGFSPSIGDSPGGALRGVERVWRNTGMQDLSERTGVPLVNFEGGSSVEMRGSLRSYMIARPVIDADVVINVAKMKTHVLTAYTGCVKNMFGAVPGFAKGRLHSDVPRPVPFSRHIVDIYSLVRPSFNLMDAVVAMEGDGPSGGKPRKVGAILAGTDGVAVDAVAAQMMGFREVAVPMLRQAHERGLGTASLSEIEILGDDPDSFDTEGFQLPRPGLLNLIPSFIVKALKPWIWVYPEMSKDWGCQAERCGLCVRSCPVGAIEMTETGPVVDRKTCVECLCCHEVCPHDAVRVRLSWLAGRFA
ncbi:MAG: DUF362 domain-containing protein [Candidatus Eisenbacteria bacterium]|nr:DUF362 domain-containing protein [Candidatus Eisenbacteria bacterium]